MFVIEHLLSLNLLSIRSVRRMQNPTGDDRQSLESWYLSGVGEDMEWASYAPPPGYDLRNEVDEIVDEINGDWVVAYTSRYCFATLCVVLTLRSFHSSYFQSTYQDRLLTILVHELVIRTVK